MVQKKAEPETPASSAEHPVVLELAIRISRIDTTKRGFNRCQAKEHADTIARFHEVVKLISGEASARAAAATSSSLKAKQRADMGVTTAQLRGSLAEASSRQHFADARQHTIQTMLLLADLTMEGTTADVEQALWSLLEPSQTRARF